MRAWIAALAVVLLAGCGGAEPEAAPKKPPAGMFDVNGHAMFIECKGDGGPTVVLDSGLGVDSTSTRAAVRPQVARFTRVWPLLGRRGACERRRALEQNPEGVRYADLLASDEQLREVRGDFPPVPLVVLRHGISFDAGGRPVPRIERLWGDLQEDEPDVVAGAIREVVEAAR